MKHMSGTTFEVANQITRLKLWHDLYAIYWVKGEFIDRLASPRREKRSSLLKQGKQLNDLGYF